MRKGSTEEMIDRSITQTLGRSLMTSATTLIVMVPLALIAGEAIREFVLPLMVGVIAGAYSSIAICSPLYYEFSKPGSMSKYEKQVKASQKKQKKENIKNETPEPDMIEAPAEENSTETPVKKESDDKNKKRSKRYVKGNKK